MKRATLIRSFLLGLALTAIGSASYADKCVPDPNAICPFIYAPVKCNDGVTYTNQCFADAACAVGCHPA
jgi:Kazal-type serine protease inhibitor-like protein